MEYVVALIGLALAFGLGYFFGARRVAPQGESALETLKSLTGARPRIPPR